MKMDKNTIFGIVIILAIFIGFSWYNQPSEEEKLRAVEIRDSIANVQLEIEKEAKLKAEELKQEAILADVPSENIDPVLAESINAAQMNSRYGSFVNTVDQEQKFITLENDFIKLKLSTRGGKVYSTEIKNYQTYDSLPLILFDGEENMFGFEFGAENRMFFSDTLHFAPETTETELYAKNGAKSASLRLKADDNRYVEYKYTLEPNSYIVDYDINVVGMESLIPEISNYIPIIWKAELPSLEKGVDNENNYTSIYYNNNAGDIDYLSPRSDQDDDKIDKTKWIAYKHQFFSSVLIADTHFDDAKINYEKITDKEKYLKTMYSDITVPYSSNREQIVNLSFYFGPNHYNTLKDQVIGENENLQLEELVDLGWLIFAWVNKFAVIPVFNWLDNYIVSYGLIILILTLLLKLVLFPLTYKSYLSTAKMRVLKPQIDEINERIPKEKSMERQQATMALYKKVGVSPMGGCLPMLVQMPILFAMFRFFPSSIELRQKAFLWADDLSSYDAIFSWTTEIPLISTYYGNHISLFTLLMTASTIIYTKMNSQMSMSNTQMPGMKTMMYIMPVMFLFIFNNYAAGLSYYYFLANIVTFGQMALMKKFVDDGAILKKLEAGKKKGPVKKSKLQQRLEQAQKKKMKR